MFRSNDYTLVQIGSLRNGEDVFYYLWVFLFLPVLCGVLFSVPIYFAFKLNNIIYLILLVVGVLIAEYFLYTHYVSQANLMNGVYNGLISVLVLSLLFFRAAGRLFKLKV